MTLYDKHQKEAAELNSFLFDDTNRGATIEEHNQTRTNEQLVQTAQEQQAALLKATDQSEADLVKTLESQGMDTAKATKTAQGYLSVNKILNDNKESK